MAAIQLPPDYFGSRPAVFGPLIQGFNDALDDVHSNVALTQDAWQFTTHPDVVGSLAIVDADDGTINDAVAAEHTAIVATPTGDALAAYAAGDQLAGSADSSGSAAAAHEVGVTNYVPNPPNVPDEPPGNAAGSETRSVDQFVARPVVVQAPPETATLPQESQSLAQPETESPSPSVAPEPGEAPPEAILASALPVQGREAPAVPWPAVPYVTSDELVEILGQLEATIIVMT